MPRMEKDELHDKAVLWPYLTNDEFNESIVGSPEEINVRWETKRVESKDALGNTVMLDATVVVDRDIALGSRMWLGELEYWYGTGSAGQDDELMQVALFSRIPYVKGRIHRRVVNLVRFKDAP